MADLREISSDGFATNMAFLETLFGKPVEEVAGFLDQVNSEFRLAGEMAVVLGTLGHMKGKQARKAFDTATEHYKAILAIWLIHQQHDPEITRH